MSKPNTQSTQRKPKKQAVQKAAAEIIAENPTRRSRAERAMVVLTTTSYPHYLLGNIVHAMSAGEATECKKALDVENKFGLLDFIRGITLNATGEKLVLEIGHLRIDATSTRVDNQLEREQTLTRFEGTAQSLEQLRQDTTLAGNLVDIFHRNQVRGMTRVHDINAKNWKLVEKKITIGNTNGLGGLGRSETVYEFTKEDAVKLLNDTLASNNFVLSLGSESIVIAANESTLEITYVVPAKGKA